MRHLLLSTIILLISTVSVFSQENDSNESSQSNEQNSEKESDNKKQEIDLLFNIGVGPAEMRLVDFYTDSIDGINNDTDPILRGIELNLSVEAPKETLLKFKDKAPKGYEWLLDGEISVRVPHIPETIFIHNDEGKKEAYGATWTVLGIGIGFGPSFLNINFHGGFIGTLLHYRDYEFDQNIAFIRPGVEGTFSLNSKLFRFFELEVGTKGALYLPTRVYNDREFYKIRTNYAMFHVKIPFSTEVEI